MDLVYALVMFRRIQKRSVLVGFVRLLRSYSEPTPKRTPKFVCPKRRRMDGNGQESAKSNDSVLPGNERRGVRHEAGQPRHGSHTPRLACGQAAIGRSRMLSRSPLPELASGPPLRRHTRYRRRPCPKSISFAHILPTLFRELAGNPGNRREYQRWATMPGNVEIPTKNGTIPTIWNSAGKPPTIWWRSTWSSSASGNKGRNINDSRFPDSHRAVLCPHFAHTLRKPWRPCLRRVCQGRRRTDRHRCPTSSPQNGAPTAVAPS